MMSENLGRMTRETRSLVQVQSRSQHMRTQRRSCLRGVRESGKRGSCVKHISAVHRLSVRGSVHGKNVGHYVGAKGENYILCEA